ncbi:MAG TPA: cytochrome c biogenesis protein CcsA [Ktedonobacterales bacterium]
MQSVIQGPARGRLEDITRRAPVVGAALGWLGRYGELALLGLTTLGMLLTIWAAFIYAPTELVEGPVQRIFYVHVPLAWISYLAFFFVLVGSALYLWRRDDRWDSFARVNAEIGVVFTTLVLISGSLWGRAFWGAWWVWDERLTTSLLMWFIYVGYLALRSFTGRTASGARAAAVVGILGFIVTPINYMSVKWWRTLHPDQVLPLGGTPQLPGSMITALMISLATFTLLYALLAIEVYKLERAQTLAESLRVEAELLEADEQAPAGGQ